MTRLCPVLASSLFISVLILNVPVSETEYVQFKCEFELPLAPVIVSLVNLLHRVVSVKVAEFSASPHPHEYEPKETIDLLREVA